MIHVRNETELNKLCTHISSAFYDIVTEFYAELKEASYIPEVVGPDEFSLHSGHIVVLESFESERDINNLLTSWPEYIEKVETSEGTVLKIVVMEDNDFIMTYFTKKGEHPEVDEWVNLYIEE